MNFSPIFTITETITNNLNLIERARGFLDAATLSENWLTAMQNKMLVLEAHHTTHIEGTQLTLDDSKKLLSGEQIDNADPDDVRELLNYRDAFELVAGNLKSGYPISEGLIREIHKRLVQGVRGNAAAPGEYRKVPNYVVNSITKEVIYTPPPAHEVPLMMAELVKWINLDKKTPSVLMSGIAQFQLVHIHPFLDGNGRTARLLSTLCLYQQDYDFKRLFTISEYYDRNRQDYYQAIQSVRHHQMDMTEWLEYFTEGLATQLKEVRIQAEQIIKTDLILSTASKTEVKERTRKVLEYLLAHGKATLNECEQVLAIPRRTLQRDLKLLVEKGFIKEVATSPNDPFKHYEAVF